MNGKNNSFGHRKRLREKFLLGGLSGFLDYEIVELLLTLGTPRSDCKQQAKMSIEKFKSLNGVLNASSEELQLIKGIGPSNIFGLKLVKAVSERCSKQTLKNVDQFKNPKELFPYLKEKIGAEPKECFVLLFFNSANKLILDEVSIGSLNSSIIHPREVFKKAILASANSVVVAHNHPSGNNNPSNEDVDTTIRLMESGKLLGIDVIDHLIITSDSYYSFKESYFK